MVPLSTEGLNMSKSYVVANDKFMSGWAGVNRSLVAIECETSDDVDAATAWLQNRSEMKRVRYNLNLPKLRTGDHLSVWTRATHSHIFRG